MLSVSVVRAEAGAQFGFVEEFVRSGCVLEGKFGSEKGPVNVGGVATAQEGQQC